MNEMISANWLKVLVYFLFIWSFNLLCLMNEIAVGGVVKSAVSGFQETIFTGQELMLLVLHKFSERYPERVCVCVCVGKRREHNNWIW